MILFTPNQPHQLEQDIRGIINRKASDAFKNAFIFRNENHATHDGAYSLDENAYLVANVGEHDVELFESFLTQHPFTHVDVYLPTDDQSEHIHVFATRPDGTRVLHSTLSAENFEYAHAAIDLLEPLNLSDIDEQDRYVFTSTLVSLLGEGAELWCVTTSSDATLYDNDREAKADVPYNEVRSTKIEHFTIDEAGVVQYKRLYVRQVRDLVFTDEPE